MPHYPKGREKNGKTTGGKRAGVVLAAIAWALFPAPAGAVGDPFPPPPPPPRYEVPPWPLPDEPGPPPPPSRPSPPSKARPTADGVLTAVNHHRERAGCAPVRPHAALRRAAQAHSDYLARSGRLTHTGADGSSPADRMRAAGFRPRHSAENLTAGQRGADAAVGAWLDSPAHRKILLTCHYTHAGVGVAAGAGGPWWTLDLASPTR
ncbi:CAP domain-containing protein [Streptomyces flavalbus]|uniref:CAP domain-containing protein n=1 Tax=Streptomyces flavalbus TaxID=2665155 RepID=A0ABW2W7W0_9ACTN